MKPIWSVIIFLFLLTSSVLSSVHSYRCAQDDIEADLSQALNRTLRDKKDLYITPDTIRTYRSYITLDRVRNSAFLSYNLPNEKPEGLSSRSMICRVGNKSLSFRGHANCSMATIFGLSDQRPALILMLLALLWCLVYAAIYRNKALNVTAQTTNRNYFGGLQYDDEADCFVNERGTILHLTPMQQQLMRLFFASKEHRLTKRTICNALWPGKEDASDTLYTLIRRLRPTIGTYSRLEIKTSRGVYQLTEKQNSSSAAVPSQLNT